MKLPEYSADHCWCGCGTKLAPTARWYRQGHDTKHIAFLVEAGVNADLAKAILPTEKMFMRFLYERYGK
jgi:hypothetical protein